jgi:hypothetical protein
MYAAWLPVAMAFASASATCLEMTLREGVRWRRAQAHEMGAHLVDRSVLAPTITQGTSASPQKSMILS